MKGENCGQDVLYERIWKQKYNTKEEIKESSARNMEERQSVREVKIM